jgi:hypothetical protein
MEDNLYYTDIWAGDYYSIEGKGLSGWINEHGTKTPLGSHTKEFHFGIIGDAVYNSDGNFVDFETRESIAKGPSTLRFFKQYTGKQVSLYRIPNITREENIRAMRSISLIGDKGYGFKDFALCIIDVAMLCTTLQFPPYTPEQFNVSRNDEYICTELPAYAANSIGKNIEPPEKLNLWDIPVLYLQAIEEGRLTRYYKGDLKDINLKG